MVAAHIRLEPDPLGGVCSLQAWDTRTRDQDSIIAASCSGVKHASARRELPTSFPPLDRTAAPCIGFRHAITPGVPAGGFYAGRRPESGRCCNPEVFSLGEGA